MTLQKAFAAASSALGAFDPASFLAQIAAIDGRIGEVDCALVTAASRVRDLEADADRLDAAGPDRDGAAAALLAGHPLPAGPTVMRDEARTIRAGLAGLRQRRNDLLEQRKAVLRELEASVSEGLDPISEGLATAITQAFAEVSGLIGLAADVANAANSPQLAELLRRLYDIREAMRQNRFLAEQRPEFDASTALELARNLRTVRQAPRERPPEAADMHAPSSIRPGPMRSTYL